MAKHSCKHSSKKVSGSWNTKCFDKQAIDWTPRFWRSKKWRVVIRVEMRWSEESFLFAQIQFKRRKNAILSWWMISDMLPCSKQQWTLWFINSLLKNWQFSLLISFRMPSPRRVRFLKFIHIGTSGKRRACCIFVKLI